MVLGTALGSDGFVQASFRAKRADKAALVATCKPPGCGSSFDATQQ